MQPIRGGAQPSSLGAEAPPLVPMPMVFSLGISSCGVCAQHILFEH